jgi:serine/threonine protein kinase/WD40 repeat protein/DNA-binding winged helix-turn-helix (wHTH) protein
MQRGTDMEIRVLGPIEVGDGEPISIGGPRQRRLLAALVPRAGEVVSLDQLIEVVWSGEEPPDRAAHNVHTYVARIRSALAPSGLDDRLRTVPPGYVLEVQPDQLDSELFEQLAGRARRLLEQGDRATAVDVAREALTLWRGRPYAEFADEEWVGTEVARLEEIRVSATETLAEALVESGQHSDAIAELEGLIAEHPLRETPRRLLMLALFRSGRQAEALRAFQNFRAELAESVGVEPSAELVELDRAIAADSAELRQPDTSMAAGAYQIHQQIGQGAFAVVYRGYQTGLDRPVAIKAIRAELANRPEFIRRFEAEAHMVARLEHPHIVPLYDYWREPDRAYLVMRWLPGGTLEQSLDQGPWPLARAARMVGQIGTALAAAHRVGVVHRDVKPANIVLDDEGNTFLTDFGIALEAEDLARPEAALSQGSPAYASPEQLRRHPAGPTADVHGLAIATYEALTAELPFGDSPDPATALRRQLEEPIPHISRRHPEFPVAVDEVLQRATAKDPADRYQDIREFVDAFMHASGMAESFVTSPVVEGDHTSRPRQLTVVSIGMENPYKGLRAFDEGDADDFFGRERLVDELVSRLSGEGDEQRLLAVVGPSGSGKSSAVRAGLVPALRQGAVDGSDRWFITNMNPGAHPFDQLESALLRVAVHPPAALADQLSAGPRGILRGVRRVLPDDSTSLLIVIDQFEELFTLCDDDTVRTRFLAGLAAAAAEPLSPVRVVLTLRADFYDRPLRYPEFASLIKQNSVTVTPLAGDELEHAIVDPAARAGVEFEPGLVAQIVADVGSQPGALPLLQYALTELFDTNVSGLLFLESYREMGGLTGALARRADELHQSAEPAEQEAIRHLFGRLITLGEGSEDTRRRVELDELAVDPPTQRVIDLFGAARLFTFDHDPSTRAPTVEVAHEALIREWPRLRGWLDDDRQGLRVHRHLTSSAVAWVERGRDDGDLYRGVRLDAAEAWTTSAAPALNPLESEFLEASVARRDTEEEAERNRIRRLRRLLVTTGIVAVVALDAGAIADDQAALAAESEAAATENAALADQRADEAIAARAQADLERLRAVAISIAPDNPGTAALLALEANQLEPSVEGLSVIHQILTTVPGFQRSIPDRSYMKSELLADEVTLAAVGRDAIDVWDLRTTEQIRTIAHDNPPQTSILDATADGDVAAVRGDLDETFLYDLTTGETLGSLAHDANVNDLSISPDGSSLAVALSDGTVEIWDLTTVELETTLDTGETDVFFARWSPTEDRIAVVTLTSEVQFWDPANEEMLWADTAPAGGIVNLNTPFAFLYSSDGSLLVFVSGSLEGELRVYETLDGSQPVPPTAISGAQEGFSLDSMYWIDEEARIIAVPSQDNIASFDLTTGLQGPELLEGFVKQASDVEYSASLARFIVVGASGLEYWSTDRSGPLERVLPLSAEQQSATAAGGTVLPSLAADGSELLVSVFAVPPNLPATTSFDLTTDPPVSGIFDADGALTIGFGAFTLLAENFTAQILDSSHDPLGPPVPIPFDFTELSVSPDGRYFAFGRLGGIADLYTGTGEFLTTLAIGEGAQYEGAQTGPSFTYDGEYVMVVTTRGDYAMWSTETLERVDIPGEWTWATLMGEWLFVGVENGTFTRLDPTTFERVGEPIINPLRGLGYGKVDETNERVAATGTEVVKVWDLETGLQLGRDLPYWGGASRIEFSEDGKLLSVPDVDRVTLWNFDTETWADIACEMAGRNLTQDEWDQLGPRTIERRATCPQYPL